MLGRASGQEPSCVVIERLRARVTYTTERAGRPADPSVTGTRSVHRDRTPCRLSETRPRAETLAEVLPTRAPSERLGYRIPTQPLTPGPPYRVALDLERLLPKLLCVLERLLPCQPLSCRSREPAERRTDRLASPRPSPCALRPRGSAHARNPATNLWHPQPRHAAYPQVRAPVKTYSQVSQGDHPPRRTRERSALLFPRTVTGGSLREPERGWSGSPRQSRTPLRDVNDHQGTTCGRHRSGLTGSLYGDYSRSQDREVLQGPSRPVDGLKRASAASVVRVCLHPRPWCSRGSISSPVAIRCATCFASAALP